MIESQSTRPTFTTTYLPTGSFPGSNTFSVTCRVPQSPTCQHKPEPHDSSVQLGVSMHHRVHECNDFDTFIGASFSIYMGPGGRFNNAYELLTLRALKISMFHKRFIFQCMGKIFCAEFQRYPLKFHTKYLTHTLKDMNFIQHWNFKSS